LVIVFSAAPGFSVPEARANSSENQPELQLAAAFELPKLPGLSGQVADWRQWDSFFTFIVKRFGQDLSGDLRDSLGEAFLDSRYELTNSVAPSKGGGNPVPELFVSSWKRLSPIMNKAMPGMAKQTAGQYASFIGAADKLAALGPQLGVGQFSPDALRGLARILEPGAKVDPLAYNLNVDSALRNLVGFGAPLGAPRFSSGVKQSRLQRPILLPGVQEASVATYWAGREALAGEPDIKKLNQWVPEDKELQSYLAEVRSLLAGLSDKVAAKTKLSEDRKPLYRQIVFAAAWQESCWRQFIKKGKSVTPLASATGDVGLMQVNQKTWRGLYDLKGLGGDIEYNGHAGGEILHYYLTRYAIRKNEDKQQGGNLARATYSAYNGGPGHLTRYRAARQNPELKKVDDAFWEKFQTVSSGRELEVLRCYQK
jgi:hypothetical protein